eukprot:gnl/MRDRNA2_/MRDRNA2_40378_c0_seq1.p1 gnl/MRDRNA2_/MRDRNA2_40378_c0~~gnl/MRDRNA2_/MRDRNA2_40378_c0_seq1.p1  ORF type:complete len:327 (-),score=51.77 gnl/MRDRNA2_/MRDRNA2_40378_c0_seq1:209-1138(-)
MNDAALELASELLGHSVTQTICSLRNNSNGKDGLVAFLTSGCDYRWTHLVMLEAEVGRELARRGEFERAARLLRKANIHFVEMMKLPYFLPRSWTGVYDINYNSERYPSPGPRWPDEQVPLLKFLEASYEVFRKDLEKIRKEQGLFDLLQYLERNAEGNDHAREDDWDIVELADTREDEQWKEHACQFTRQTCDLLRERPEFQCDHAAAYYNRMRPGAWIKPHIGNSPRLVVHLGLDIPPDPVFLYVGNVKLRWETGRAHAIDDTYIHSVRHEGAPQDRVPERYILHLLICHPCEDSQRPFYEGLNVAC